MANINPIFSIEYPNLDTLLFIRKQYPQLADMEIGTSIIDEECIIVHYLPAEDKANQVAEELIYFGTLLSSTKHFHRTDDQYDLVYRCVSLAHEVEESKTVEAFSSLDEGEKIKVKIEVPSFERVNQVSVEHARRNDVLTITYPRDKTVFAGVNFKVPNLTLVPQTEVINAILFMLKDKFGSQPELRLYIGKYNVTVHIFDFTRFCIGTKANIGEVVSNINAAVLKREHLSEPWVEVVNQNNPKPVTLGDLLRSHLANSQQAEAPAVELPVVETEDDVTKGDKTLGVSCVDMGHPGPYTLEEVFDNIAKQSNPQQAESPAVESLEVETFITESKPDEVLGYVGASYDGEMDQLSITYPYDKTVFTSINVDDPEEYFENIKTISDGVRTIFKREYDFEANPRLLGIKDMIKIYIDDLSKVAERVRKVSGPFDPGIEKAILEEVITNIVPKISALVLKPQFIANRPD